MPRSIRVSIAAHAARSDGRGVLSTGLARERGEQARKFASDRSEKFVPSTAGRLAGLPRKAAGRVGNLPAGEFRPKPAAGRRARREGAQAAACVGLLAP